MARIIDVTANFKPHTELKLYDFLGIDKTKAKGLDVAGCIAEMDANGVAMTGIVAGVVQNGLRGPVLATHVDEVYPVLEKHPDRFFGWVGIDPLGGRATLRYIERAVRELGFIGVHVYPHWFGVPVNARDYWPIYAKCCELDVPITLQVGRQSPRSGAKLSAHPVWLDDVACEFPELKLIGLHIGTPWDSDMTSLCVAHENVFMIADAHPPRSWSQPMLDYLAQRDWINKDGADKVMWGTDWPVQNLTQSIAEVRALDLPDATKQKLLGENAIRILGLRLPPER